MRGGPGGGTATFVLGDIVGSTRLWAESGEAMPGALGALEAVVDECLERHGGERPPEQGEGDSFLVVFGVASAATAFALDVQRELRDSPISVRVGVHTGDALQRADGRWMGHTVNRAARLRDAANGGQVLVSGATAELVVESLPDGAWLKDLGTLTPDEQRLLRRLSVFSGGFSLEGAEHVGSDDASSSWGTVELLTGLADIGEKLFMSPATVKTHLTHIFAKLGVSNRAELASLAASRVSAS